MDVWIDEAYVGVAAAAICTVAVFAAVAVVV